MNSFKESKPFPHLIIPNFLSEGEASKLLEAIKKENFEEKRSDLFHFFQSSDLKFSKNKEIKKFVEHMNGEKFRAEIFEKTGIKTSKSMDMFASIYTNTHYLLCHDDCLLGRKIAYILYLTKDFKEKDGGALVLFEDSKGLPKQISKRIIPSWNTLVLFEVGSKSWHEVEEVLTNKKRFAIGGWLH